MEGIDAWADLRRDVHRRFLAMEPLTWPDPHANGEIPEWEYGQVSSNRQVIIAQMRVEAWVISLTHTALAERGETPVPEGCITAYVVRSFRPQTLGLLIATSYEGDVLLAVDAPRIDVERFPDCGCDGCDRGSESLVNQIDNVMADVITGELRVEQTEDVLTVIGSHGTHSRMNGPVTATIGVWHGATWLDS